VNMNCRSFERWLDDGMPESTAAGARGHAAGCSRCAEAMRSWLEVDALLEAPVGRAPASFSDRVMTRVAGSNAAELAARRTRARWARNFRPATAWWVEAAAQPAAVLAMAVASLLVWQRAALRALATDLATGNYTLPSIPWLAFLERSEVAAGVAFAFLPVAVLAGWASYRLAERLVRGRFRAHGMPLGITT